MNPVLSSRLIPVLVAQVDRRWVGDWQCHAPRFSRPALHAIMERPCCVYQTVPRCRAPFYPVLITFDIIEASSWAVYSMTSIAYCPPPWPASVLECIHVHEHDSACVRGILYFRCPVAWPYLG